MIFFKFLLTWLLFTPCVVHSFKYEEKNSNNRTDTSIRYMPRQLEYMSLINTLLQQSNVLSSVDGILLAATTVIASFITRFKPLLIATSMSYILYVGGVMFFPASIQQLGLPTLEDPSFPTGRSMDGESRLYENAFTETFTKGMKLSPIMNIITNVTVTVVSDTMARLRALSKMLLKQMSLMQSNMAYAATMLSNECVSRFMCRVGQFTQVNFPTASSLLRTIADNYPGMDDFAIAAVKGTSSSNCSLLYPDCVA